MTERPDPYRLLQATVDALLERSRAVAAAAADAGGSVWGHLPEPVPAAVRRMLLSVRQVAEQMPPITAEIDVLVEEVQAKRLSIQALQKELAALDDQLAVLERSLAPVQGWSRQWTRVRDALLSSLDEVTGED